MHDSYLGRTKRILTLVFTGAETCAVHMDPAELAAVLDVIVDNALCYTPVGGRVDLSVTVSDNRATVTITDTGPGIPEELRSRVFRPVLSGSIPLVLKVAALALLSPATS